MQNFELHYKRLILFWIASTSLLLSGFSLTHEVISHQLIILLLCNCCGIILIYGLNGTLNKNHSLMVNIRQFLKIPLHLYTILLFCALVVPLALIAFSPFIIILLIVSCSIGIFYTINLPIRHHHFQLKRIVILKNILIAYGWASLILIGAGQFELPLVEPMFYFTFFQVFIGSIIRDLPDIALDIENNIDTIPIRLGPFKTLNYLHLINMMSGIGIVLYVNHFGFRLMIISIMTWRYINLVFLKKDISSKIWSQTLNLMTCVLINIFLILTLTLFP